MWPGLVGMQNTNVTTLKQSSFSVLSLGLGHPQSAAGPWTAIALKVTCKKFSTTTVTQLEKAPSHQAVQNLEMRLDLVVKTSGLFTETSCLSWSSPHVQKSHNTGDQVQPSENPNCTTGAYVSFHALEAPT